MNRFSPNYLVLPFLILTAAIMIGCTASKTELDLTTYDPAQDHQKIAAYYNHEAAKLR